jgi:acyl carrier protein
MIETFLQIVRETSSDISEQDLKLPVRDIGIDSIDLVVIRVALEKYFRHEISDTEWYQLNTLDEVLNYFTSKGLEVKKPVISSKRVEFDKMIEVTMPRMANNSLSENWLLKECGDLHWKLLSDGLGQKSKEFKDEMGNRLYATFTRISYTCSPLNSFQENDIINFKGSIKRFGNNTYLSDMDGKSQNSFLTARLMTSFSLRSSNDNSKIEKSNPRVRISHIEEIKTTPEFLNNFRLIRKNLIDTWETFHFKFPVTNENIFENNYCINPYYDINGVGLLYFAAYPVISDFSLSKFFLEKFGSRDWTDRYQTIGRDINYFANCNANETIVTRLNSFELVDNRYLKLETSLSRLSDSVVLAKIFTVKEKTS